MYLYSFKNKGLFRRVKVITKNIFLFAVLLISNNAFSLSCAEINEEFYYSCEDSACTPEFQVSFKKSGGSCARRPIVIDDNESVSSYFSPHVAKLASSGSGLYKLTIPFRYWKYELITGIQQFRKKLNEEFYYLLTNPDTGEKSTELDIDSFLSSDVGGVSFEFVGLLDDSIVHKIKENRVSDQYLGLVKYLLYALIYWGGFLVCLSALVYSVNRFYKNLYLTSKVDKTSLVIQSLVLVISSAGFMTISWDIWVGVFLFPAVVVLLICDDLGNTS